ncbi:MAG: CBS domain-containing protein [Pirellulales bacterium]|nr:CBS domain-containing protein [Pirellulales bacterium]
MDIELNLNTETVAHAGMVEPCCVEPNVTVRELLELLKARKTGSAIICREGVLAGIFTERDALRLMAANANLDAPISSVMTTNVTTLPADAKVGQAISQMSGGGYRRLPIVDVAKRPVGLVKVSGIVHYLVQHFPKAVYNQPPVARAATQEREGA